MTNEDYIGRLSIRGKEVEIGMDDYGQCYYFEFVNDNGELESYSCGTYNTEFIEEIVSCLDPKGFTISMFGKEYWDEQTQNMKQRYELHKGDEWYEKWYRDIVLPRDTKDYSLYDFDELYKQISEQQNK